MDKRQLDDQKRIESWFKDHVAEYALVGLNTDNPIEVLYWAKPGTNTYSIVYWCQRGNLCVFGDLGSAVYRWYSNHDLSWISTCDLHYFASKCEASEYGRKYESWDSNKADNELNDLVEQEIVTTEKLEETGAFGQTFSKTEWLFWLHNFGIDVFGSDFYEYSDIGKIIDIRCHAHLIGLKMAITQLKENMTI